MIKNNFVRYRPESDTFYFHFVHVDNMADMSRDELIDYVQQKDEWECPDEGDFLERLFDDAKRRYQDRVEMNKLMRELLEGNNLVYIIHTYKQYKRM